RGSVDAGSHRQEQNRRSADNRQSTNPAGHPRPAAKNSRSISDRRADRGGATARCRSARSRGGCVQGRHERERRPRKADQPVDWLPERHPAQSERRGSPDRQPGQRLCPGAFEPGARRGQPLSGHAKGIQPGPRYHQQAHLHRDDGRDLAENGQDHHRREGRRSHPPLFAARSHDQEAARDDRGTRTMTKQGLTIAVIAILFFLLILGASPLFVVDVTQTAIVVQLGKPVRIVMEPGLYIKVPFVQEVTYFDKRLLDYDSDAQDVITQDKKTLLLDNFAKWRIIDPLKVYQNFQSQRGALQRLHDIIYSELRVELGRHDLAEIVSTARAELMKVVTQRANEKASAYGITIQDVRIKRADLPQENEKTVFQRMQAEREQQAKQYRAEGAEEAQKIRSDAEKDREIILAQAYKESEELRGAGDAKAFRIYADAYRQDPKFFDFTRSMEAYKKSFDERSTLVMSPDSEFFHYLKQR